MLPTRVKNRTKRVVLATSPHSDSWPFAQLQHPMAEARRETSSKPFNFCRRHKFGLLFGLGDALLAGWEQVEAAVVYNICVYIYICIHTHTHTHAYVLYCVLMYSRLHECEQPYAIRCILYFAFYVVYALYRGCPYLGAAPGSGRSSLPPHSTL